MKSQRTIKDIRSERDQIGDRLRQGILASVPVTRHRTNEVKQTVIKAIGADPKWRELNRELQSAINAVQARKQIEEISLDMF